jgi:hypothetical protein
VEAWCRNVALTYISTYEERRNLLLDIETNVPNITTKTCGIISLHELAKLPTARNFSDFGNSLGCIKYFHQQYCKNDYADYKKAFLATYKSCQTSKRAGKSLRQCLFCHEFKLKAGQWSWTCRKNECLKADAAWVAYLANLRVPGMTTPIL